MLKENLNHFPTTFIKCLLSECEFQDNYPNHSLPNPFPTCTIIIHMRQDHVKYDLDKTKIFLHIKRGLRHKMKKFWLDDFLRSLFFEQSDWLSAKVLVIFTAAPLLLFGRSFLLTSLPTSGVECFGAFLSSLFCTLMINMLLSSHSKNMI